MNDEERDSNATPARPGPRRFPFLPATVAQWLSAALVFAVLGLVAAFAGAASGFVDLSAIPPHPAGWARFLQFGMSRSVAMHAHPPPSEEPLDSQAMIMEGAAEYSLICENCHGGPGLGQSPLALSFRPEPPLITQVARDFSPPELFFIVQNGVRYTGMPAWPVEGRPDEIWAMVAFLEAMPTMDRATYMRLARGGLDDARRDPGPGSAPGGPTNTAAGSMALAPFAASTAPRPYLPGDPQRTGSPPEATELPRTGFGHVVSAGDALSRCAMCHGADGSGRSGGAFPNLTLQTPQYLYDALRAFAAGDRRSGIMWEVAADLSDDQMRAFATRVGSGPALASPREAGGAGPSQTATLDRGRQIAADGLNSAGKAEAPGGSDPPTPAVERCSSCHINMTYLGKIFPAISGQNAAYLRMQLRMFRDGGRGDTASYDPMPADAHRLNDADIAAVASFYAALPPSAKVR